MPGNEQRSILEGATFGMPLSRPLSDAQLTDLAPIVGADPSSEKHASEVTQSQRGDAQGKALIEKARTLGVPINDLLTADGDEIAWRADKDFRAPINGVLVEFRKDEPIRDRHLIVETQRGRCPVSSLESELWRRVAMTQAAKAPAEMIMLKPTFMGMGIDLKEIARRGWPRLKRWWAGL